MGEITIQIDYHDEPIPHTDIMTWYAAFVVRNDDYPDMLWWDAPFDSPEAAEHAARDYLRGLVGEVQS